MSKPRVKITKSGKPSFWYADLVGQEFEVEPYWSDKYAVSEDLDQEGPIRAIDMDDCEVIDE